LADDISCVTSHSDLDQTLWTVLTNFLAKTNQIYPVPKTKTDQKGNQKLSEKDPILAACASNAQELGQKPIAEALIPLLGAAQSQAGKTKFPANLRRAAAPRSGKGLKATSSYP
jgi:hypothetical protein